MSDGLWMRDDGWRTLIVVEDISLMISTCIMSLSHTHRIVCEIDIAVIA